MDHFYRVIRQILFFFVGVCLAWLSIVPAHAAMQWSGYTYGNATPLAGCQTYIGHYGITSASVYSITDLTHVVCAFSDGSHNTTVTGSGACDPGYAEDPADDICKPTVNCASKNGNVYSSGYYDYGTSPGAGFSAFACAGGCSLMFTGGYPAGRSLVGGIYHYFAQGSYSYTGVSCSTGSAPPSSTAGISSPSCATGQVMGTVNGVTTCLAGGVPQNPNVTPSPPKTDTTNKTVTNNPDGSTTTTTTTTKSDGSSTTTTTITQPSGASTTTTIDTPPATSDPLPDFCKTNPSAPACKPKDPMDEFCKNNPTVNMCKTSKFCDDNPNMQICKESVWSGACGAFTCNGDAVQCAISLDQHKRNCALFDQSTALSDFGNQVASGADPQSGTLPSPSNSEAVNVVTRMSGYTSQQWLSRAALPSPSFTALGHVYTFDTSLLSQLFSAVGYILVAISGIVAARIIGGAS